MPTVTRKTTFNAVVVLESLPLTQTLTGQGLYHDVIAPNAQTASNMHAGYQYVPDLSSFLEAIAALTMRVQSDGIRPILHLETHGGDHGLGLASGELLDWPTLRSALIPLNVATHNSLIVVVAACDGGNLIHTLEPTDRSPVWGIVGPARPMLPWDFEAAFPHFYDALLRTNDLNLAVDALRASTSHYVDAWHFYSAEMMFGLGFGSHLSALAPVDVRRALEEELVAEGRARGSITASTEPSVRLLIQHTLADHAGFFAQLKDHFLMIDLYPEEAPRFPLTLSQALQIYSANTPIL